jgi:hypothetical protein
MLNIQGTPQPLDKTLNQAYIDALKKHIELLEAKKREVEKVIIDHGMTIGYTNGVIAGLNFAINQLYENINQLEK